MKFKIRKLKPEDFDLGLIQTLNNLSPCLPISKSRRKKLFSNIHNQSSTFTFVAENGGAQREIVGTAMAVIISRVSRGGSRSMRIEDVAVRKGYEGQGIGGSLVKKIINLAKKIDCYKVELSCGEKNKNFYKKLGFSKHELSMRLDL